MLKKSKSILLLAIISFSFISAFPFKTAATENNSEEIGANVYSEEVGFSQRTTPPPTSSAYYYNSSYNPFYSARLVTQCTWYAWGRAYEIMGKRPNLSTGNAKNWFGYNRDNGIYSYSTNFYAAKPGAILCCDDGGATGHVAIVEEVAADGSPSKISEGGWYGSADYTANFNYADGYYGAQLKFHYGKNYNGGFQGYIYLDDGNPDPTPVDIGTNFYGFIISMSAWKHLTVDSNVNVTLRSEKPEKSPDQVFKFERQSDGSYKIISTANGMCLDVKDASSASCANVGVWYDNNSDAQRWYIYGSSGQYTLRAKCTNCKLDLYGASTADGTNIHMYDISHENAQKFQIWSLEDRPFASDIGDNFTAPILNTKSWITLENNNGNVILNKEVGKSHQLWKFQRNLDGSYTIFSCLDGKCIDLKDFSHADGTNIGVQTPNNTDAQRWYIYNNGSYCEIKSKESGKFFDVAGGSLTSGANIQAYTWNGSDYQRYNIYGGEECKIKSPTLKVETGTNLTDTVFSWDNVYGETGYNLKIWREKIWEGEAYKIAYDADRETKITLPAGTYQAYVDAYNYFDIKMSNTVTFSIEEGIEPITSILGDTDLDGHITISDVTAIQRQIAELDIFSEEQLAAADTNGDGKVDITDATYLQMYLAEYDVVLGKQPTA